MSGFVERVELDGPTWFAAATQAEKAGRPLTAYLATVIADAVTGMETPARETERRERSDTAAVIREMWAADCTDAQIAERLGLTPAATATRRRRLGLTVWARDQERKRRAETEYREAKEREGRRP